MKPSAYDTWREYVASELAVLRPILEKIGYTLDDEQPHLSGERYLMQAVTTTSGRKLILLGSVAASGKRVVTKATRDTKGKDELRHERMCRMAIHALPFAYHGFSSPTEMYFDEVHEFLISIQEYISQTSSFIERPLPEQFSYALAAFKAQEGAHAVTYEQVRSISRIFGRIDTNGYLDAVRTFRTNIERFGTVTDTLLPLYGEVIDSLSLHTTQIEQYGNFLTHTDFVPHNFRIKDGVLYLLDYSSIRFGNKHEGWARFLNFMTLHNPELEAAFLQYFKDNRAYEEQGSLHAMRLYRLSEIIWYYVRAVSLSEGNVLTLNTARISFWSEVLRAHLANTELPSHVRDEYIQVRDSLRTEEEQARQKGLH